jgi:polysaccharide chain length determinant protein (PEP-CTERM system associated)
MQEFLEIFRSTVRGMWIHRWWGLITAMVIGVMGVAIAYFIPNRFEATARVFVDTQSILKPVMKDLAVQPNVEQQVAMVSRTLISRPNVERVMRMADLDLKIKSPSEREKFIDDLIKDIEFKAATGGSNLYQIAYKNEKPEAAKNVVQSLLSIFVESNLGDGRRDKDQTRRFIEEQIKTYEGRLLSSESQLKEFKIKNLTVMPNLQQDYVTRASETQNALSQARLELRQAEYARDSLRKQLKDENPSLALGDSGPTLPENPNLKAKPTDLEERLDVARKKMDDLKSRFTDEHPDVIGLKRVLAQLDDQAAAERKAEAAKPAASRQQSARAAAAANPVYQQIKLSLAETEAQVASMRARVSDYETRVSQARESALTIPKVEAEYLQLTRDYENNKKNYDQLVSRREVAQMSIEMDTSAGVAEFRVVDPPRVSSKPSWPNRPLILSLALLASIASGLAACFLKDQSRPTFFDARGLRQATGMPLLGAVSHVLDVTSRARSMRQTWLFSGVSGTYFLAFLGLLAWAWLRALAR